MPFERFVRNSATELFVLLLNLYLFDVSVKFGLSPRSRRCG